MPFGHCSAHARFKELCTHVVRSNEGGRSLSLTLVSEGGIDLLGFMGAVSS